MRFSNHTGLLSKLKQTALFIMVMWFICQWKAELSKRILSLLLCIKNLILHSHELKNKYKQRVF